ncbi:uncharacterized protein LOC107039913 [Diachasma alloeum]|uniref:uncharacterized protein LOC107039913 n=1 Tax=Diachasma alloeum TaxID=454923 RepID=UPI0007381527|nr:uncharacterized protein LOC107039913 [Diachasma alloeum]
MTINVYKKNARRVCCVPNCRIKDKSNLSFHNFPSDAALRNKWMEVLKIDRPHDREMRVCSLHFSADNFTKRAMREGCQPPRKKLKTGVIPCFHQPTEKSSGFTEDRVRSNCEIHTDDNPESVPPLTQEASVVGGYVSTRCNACVQVDIQPVKFDAEVQVCNPSRDVAVQVQFDKLDVAVQTVIPQTRVDKKIQTDRSVVDEVIGNEEQLKAFTGLHSFALLTSLIICVRELKKRMGENLNDRLDIR